MNVCMYDWMNDENMNENEWMNEWMYGSMNEWLKLGKNAKTTVLVVDPEPAWVKSCWV